VTTNVDVSIGSEKVRTTLPASKLNENESKDGKDESPVTLLASTNEGNERSLLKPSTQKGGEEVKSKNMLLDDVANVGT
jgi:hypothetical protein